MSRMRSRRRWLWTGTALIVAVFAVGYLSRGESAEVRWRGIEAAMGARRWDEAEARLVRWVERAPEDGRAWLSLGAVRSFQGKDRDALAALRRVSEADPAWAVAQGSIGEIALREHDAVEGERALRAAIARDPRAIEPRRRLVYLLTLQQRTDEARVILSEMYRLAPDLRHLITLTSLVAVDSDGRELNAGLEAFLRRSPDDPWLRRAKGLTSLWQGRPADALPHLAAAAAALEADPTGRLALAECRLALRQVPGKDETDEAFLGPRPDRPADLARWWVLRGRLEEGRGRADEAIACLRKAVEVKPDDRIARYRLGQALVHRGEAEQAKPHLERAEASRVVSAELKFALTQQISSLGNAEAFERLGTLCRESGLAAEARGWFQEAVNLDPARSSAQAALARLVVAPEPPPVLPRLRDRAVATAPGESGAERVGPVAQVRFEDVAGRAGLVFRYDAGATDEKFIADTMGGGVGLIDYDEDGWLDVYFVNGCPLSFDPASPPTPNKLFRNRRDGTFEDMTDRAGVAGRGYGMGCVVGDYDGDGHDDLFVTGLGRTILYRNRGDGSFEDVTERAGVGSPRWTTAAGFGDLDGDGDLDLVAVTYVQADPRTAPACRDQDGRRMHCLPAYFPDQFDHLFRNNGDGTFTDVSREAGIEVPRGPGLGLAIADLDGDDRLDLFVGNDMAPCHLFRNLGGLRFEEVGVAAGVAYDGSGQTTATMGVVADDLDGDGLIDLFHTNFLNEPNTFLRNLGGGLFADETARVDLDAPSRGVTGWGTAAFDADNDGRLDLFVANGHLDYQVSQRRPMAQPPHLYLGQADGKFTLAPESASPYLARRLVGRGLAAGDLDNDGRVDLIVVHSDAPAALLHNATEGGRWLGVLLRGTADRRTPIGARVTCKAGGRTTVRWLTSGTSYLSANDPRLWFGLGTAAKVEQLEVRWPSGKVQSWSDLPPDRILEIREGRDPAPAAR